MPTVPHTERSISTPRLLLLLGSSGVLLFSSMQNAKINATRFLKKLFCIEGKSPDSRTNAFINVKQNADASMQSMPFVLFDNFIFVKKSPLDLNRKIIILQQTMPPLAIPPSNHPHLFKNLSSQAYPHIFRQIFPPQLQQLHIQNPPLPLKFHQARV